MKCGNCSLICYETEYGFAWHGGKCVRYLCVVVSCLFGFGLLGTSCGVRVRCDTLWVVNGVGGIMGVVYHSQELLWVSALQIERGSLGFNAKLHSLDT